MRYIRCDLQRGYVMFGVEWDFDVDDWAVAVHLWPLTIEMTYDYLEVP